ncbi:unnamed protein product [Alopecurus aequalis]
MRVSKRHRSVGVDAQHVPTVGGSGVVQGSLDDLDLISHLPDPILGTVISLLPTKDGARTQAISRRWLPLWRSDMAPLNLVADCNLCDDVTRAELVTRILSDHPGPSRRFSLHLIPFRYFRDKAAPWFRSNTLTGLEELEMTNLHEELYPLKPRRLTRFAPTLRLLKLSSCQFPDRMALPSFPHLKQLIMYDIAITEDSLQCMISGCAVLETVSLRSVRFGRLCISSQSLRSINLHALRPEGCELVIEDGPSLERLLPDFPDDGPATIRVIRAPKLKTLGFMSEGISTLHLGTTIFQKMIAVSLTAKMRTMKILALDSNGVNLNAVVNFLKCFPCLEKLYVILHPGRYKHIWLNYDPLDPIECLERHLQRVALRNYNGDSAPFIDFATFFILNAKVLKEMEIGVPDRKSDKWMCSQRRLLQVERRASRGAKIEVKSDTDARPRNHGHTHDLSMDDPFDKPLCGCDKCARYI